eukprot:GHVR01053440.1.p2 GENE.GHVR01053440.1~~GHVR01053440.1.p2  ORF type:complete len:106 (-),score=20.09 GHVR01053440.1:91-408(-)
MVAVEYPLAHSLNEEERDPVADICVRGVWNPQTNTLLDVGVMDTDAPSYSKIPVQEVLTRRAREKKAKYLSIAAELRATFTPLIFSVDGAMEEEAVVFIKKLAKK